MEPFPHTVCAGFDWRTDSNEIRNSLCSLLLYKIIGLESKKNTDVSKAIHDQADEADAQFGETGG